MTFINVPRFAIDGVLCNRKLAKLRSFEAEEGTKKTKKEKKGAKPKGEKAKMIRGFELKKLNVQLQKGELIAVVGSVGSGYVEVEIGAECEDSARSTCCRHMLL